MTAEIVLYIKVNMVGAFDWLQFKGTIYVLGFTSCLLKCIIPLLWSSTARWSQWPRSSYSSVKRQ